MTPFLDVKVIPTYSKYAAAVIWKVPGGFEDGRFTLQKSPDGINDWQEVAADNAVERLVDENFLTQGKMREFYYKVILQKDGKRYDSDSVGTFGTLKRHEFGAARWIMQLEYRHITKFTAVKIFKLNIHAPACPNCVIADTGQILGASSCLICYGTGRLGGYFPPIQSHMRILNFTPIIQDDNDQGAGAKDPINIKARMLAFPLLRKEDLLWDPATDRRYLVEISTVDYFAGKAPVIATVELVLLRSTDVRYKLGLPS